MTFTGFSFFFLFLWGPPPCVGCGSVVSKKSRFDFSLRSRALTRGAPALMRDEGLWVSLRRRSCFLPDVLTCLVSEAALKASRWRVCYLYASWLEGLTGCEHLKTCNCWRFPAIPLLITALILFECCQRSLKVPSLTVKFSFFFLTLCVCREQTS